MLRRDFLRYSVLLPFVAAPTATAQETIDIPATMFGVAVALGPGVYEVPYTVVMQNATLTGAGRAQTVIKFTGNLDAGIHAAAGDCVIENLTIAGNGAIDYGVMVGRDTSSAQTFVQNVAIKQCLTAGLYLRMSQIGTFQRVVCIGNLGVGVLSDIGPNVSNQFRACTIAANSGAGVYLRRAQTTLFDGCTIQENGGAGLHALSIGPNAVRHLTINDCYFERNNGAQAKEFGQLRIEASQNNIIDDVTVARGYWAPETQLHALHLNSVRGQIIHGQHANDGSVIAQGYHPNRSITIYSQMDESHKWQIAATELDKHRYVVTA